MSFQGITVRVVCERAPAVSIRIQTVSLATILLAAGLTAGCDDSAAKAANARASLGEATAVYEQAVQGYVPTGVEQDYSIFKREKLAEAAGQLETLTAASDSVSATEALILLSGVKTAQARDEVQQAAVAFAGVGQRSQGLFDQLAEVERITALIVARTGDGGSVLNALGVGAAEISQDKNDVTQTLSGIAGRREGATLDAEKFNNAAAGHFTRATEFEKQAFVAATDAAKQEAYTSAYQAELAGQAALKQAQDAQILADSLTEQTSALQNEIALLDKMAQQVGDLTRRVREEGDSAARDVSTASSDKSLAVTTMKGEFDKVKEAYNQGVEARLKRSVELSKQALDHIEAATASSARDQRASLGFDRLEAQVTLTQALTRQSRYASDFSSILRSIADNPAVSGTSAAQAAQKAAVESADKAKSFAEQAKGVIDNGLQQVEDEQLAGDSASGKAAATLAQALRAYGSQLN